MAAEYLYKCKDCGYMWNPEECEDVCNCVQCGSSNKQHIIQETGRFGCTSDKNSFAKNVNFKEK